MYLLASGKYGFVTNNRSISINNTLTLILPTEQRISLEYTDCVLLVSIAIGILTSKSHFFSISNFWVLEDSLHANQKYNYWNNYAPGIITLSLKGPYQSGDWTRCFAVTKYFLHKYFLTLINCIKFVISSQDRFGFGNSLSKAIKIQGSKFECAGYTGLF